MTATEVETEVEIEAPLSFANTLLTKKKDINGKDFYPEAICTKCDKTSCNDPIVHEGLGYWKLVSVLAPTSTVPALITESKPFFANTKTQEVFETTVERLRKERKEAKEINAMFPKEKSPTQKVLEVVLSSDKPLSGEDIAEKSGVNKYRVYKILSYLTKRKKIQRVTFSLYRKKQRT